MHETEPSRALVTGGGSGIGAALVTILRSRGFEVLAVDRDEAALQAIAATTGAATRVVDVADPEANVAMVADAVERFGGLDLVFLNAGILGRPIADQASTFGPGDLDLERYSAVVGVNLDGVVYGTLAAAAAMEPVGGAIVVTASVAGVLPWAPDPFYTATKHAAVGWVRAIAPTLAATGVRIDAICPGGVATPLVGADPADIVERPALLDPAVVADAMLETALEPGTGRAVSVVAGRTPTRLEHVFAEVPGFG